MPGLVPLTAAIILLTTTLGACGGDGAPSPETKTTTGYTSGPASRDGIGKRYMGREISHVMGHLGAGWLERDTREAEERTDLLVAALPLERDDVVADIGAGTGYFTFRMAPRVPQGKVIAVDVQPEMLAIIESRTSSANVNNVVTVLGEADDPKLDPGTVDLILLVDAYHEFEYPREMGRAMAEALVPGGRLVLVEYRAEDRRVPIKPLHKMSEAQARREIEATGLTFVENLNMLPQQHILIFSKPGGGT